MVLTIRIEESVGNALKELAAEDERKLSAYVARILRRHVKDAGKPEPEGLDAVRRKEGVKLAKRPKD